MIAIAVPIHTPKIEPVSRVSGVPGKPKGADTVLSAIRISPT